MRRLTVALLAATLALAAAAADPATIGPDALHDRIAWADRTLVVLDVRTPEEFAAGHVPGAINIPHTELAARVAELDDARDSDIVVYCRTGRRAEEALGVLGKSGFTRLLHLQGDYTRWAEEQRPVVKTE
jgi:rhodanese-related sulfurtransferase